MAEHVEGLIEAEPGSVGAPVGTIERLSKLIEATSINSFHHGERVMQLAAAKLAAAMGNHVLALAIAELPLAVEAVILPPKQHRP